MPFDDPIYLDRDSFEELMVDTDEHRLCWMYHDLLSSARIAWLLDESAGKGSDVHESWASMAWVAAGHQPGTPGAHPSAATCTMWSRAAARGTCVCGPWTSPSGRS